MSGSGTEESMPGKLRCLAKQPSFIIICVVAIECVSLDSFQRYGGTNKKRKKSMEGTLPSKDCFINMYSIHKLS